MARPKPWEVDDELWAVVEPLLPKVERRARHPGRKRLPDRLMFQGILALTISRRSCTRAAVPGPVRLARQAEKTCSIKAQRASDTSLR